LKIEPPSRLAVLKNALDHYLLKIKLIIEDPDTLEAHLKSEALNQDLLKESEKTNHLKDNLGKAYGELQGPILEIKEYRELLCRALKCYALDLESSIKSVKEKLGGGDPEFGYVGAEIEVAKRAIEEVCGTAAA
jgi:hypothetical protein